MVTTRTRLNNDKRDMNKVDSLKSSDEQNPKLGQLSPDGTVVGNKDTLPTPPDGGWGWMVVIGSFLIHVIADGVPYSFGVFLNALVDHFDAGRGDVGWISSLMIGITWCSGPLVSALTNKYGCRVVSIAGSVLAAFGFAISVFAPNLYYLYFTLGIVAGLGLGMIYLPAIVSVSYYFEKRRSFATGLAVCGSGIGTFIFAPLAKALLDEYGWRGAVLIEAGILLNCCICGSFFRPLELTKRHQQKLPAESDSNNKLNGITTKHGAAMVEAKKVCSDLTLDNCPTPLSGSLLLSQNSSSINSLPRTPVESPLEGATLQRHALVGNPSSDASDYQSNPVTDSQCVASLPRESVPHDGCFLFHLCRRSEETKGMFQQMLDLKLLKDVTFLLFVTANCVSCFGFYVPYVYLSDRAGQMGISMSNGAFLLSVIGISNTVSRVVVGWVSDRDRVNRLLMYTMSLMFAGIVTSLSIFCHTYETLLIYAALFGLFTGVIVSLSSVVLVDLLGIDRLTDSFGLMLPFIGVGVIAGPPVAGWIYDTTQSYDVPFIITGAVITFGGVMLFSLPCVQKLRERRRHLEKIHSRTETTYL